MSDIDRVRYYDGEFLRAFDFSDEQTYHIQMRRRLNRYLHRQGIAQGLQLSEDIQGSVHQVSVLPGLAIDVFGREIYVFAPYTLGDADISTNRIAKKTNYDVWLHYDKKPATPPSSGYAACNQTGEYTRWVESYRVALLESPSTPVPDPGFADADPDNPTKDGVAVLLGKVFVDPTSPTQQFSNPNPVPDPRINYLGVIAQRIQAPLPYDPETAAAPFNFLQQNWPTSPPVSLEIEPNVFASRNLIVGPDFDLTTTPPKPTPSKNIHGSVKIASDLFVQGNIYSNTHDKSDNPQFLELSLLVKQLLPQFMPDVVGTATPATIAPNPTAAGNFTTQVPITLTSKLTLVKNVTATAAISGIQFNPGVDVSHVLLLINNVSASPGPAPNQCTVSVNYTVGPVPVSKASPVVSFNLSVTAACFPS